jgi:hypothetical protein
MYIYCYLYIEISIFTSKYSEYVGQKLTDALKGREACEK